jgi:hypothetical protein
VDSSHHKIIEQSALEIIGFPMVTGFVLDYMHLACIGVMKILMSRWKNSKNAPKKVHFSPAAKSKFDEYLTTIRECIPSDFNRKCEGGLSNLSDWKATEYRLFLLYVGPVVLSDPEIIPKDMYANFLQFSTAMTYLLLENQLDKVNFVKNLLANLLVMQ